MFYCIFVTGRVVGQIEGRILGGSQGVAAGRSTRRLNCGPAPGHGRWRLPGEVLFADRAEGPEVNGLAQTLGLFRESAPGAHKAVGLSIDWGSRRVTMKGEPVELMTTYHAAFQELAMHTPPGAEARHAITAGLGHEWIGN